MKDDEWFELGYRIEGDTVTTTINGEIVTTSNGASRLDTPGTIAIQQWRTPEDGITLLKDIRIRPLD